MSDQLPAKKPTQEQDFNALVRGIAENRLSHLANTPAGRIAISRVAQAFIAAAKMAPDPSALYNCSAASIGACMILSAEHGLFPGGPSAPVYLVPKGGQLLWWIDHRGILELAKRAGLRVWADVVYAQDEFAYESGIRMDLVHRPKPGPRTWETIVAAYVTVCEDDRLIGIHVLYRDEIEKRHKARSLAIGKSWTSDPAAMCLKSVVKAAVARGVILLDSAGQSAMAADAEFTEIPTDTTVEQVPAPARARIIVPETTRALPAPSLDDFTEPTAEERAEIERAERGGK